MRPGRRRRRPAPVPRRRTGCLRSGRRSPRPAGPVGPSPSRPASCSASSSRLKRRSSSRRTRRLRASSPSSPRSGCRRCSSSLRKVTSISTGPIAEVGGQEGDQVAGGAVGPVQVLHDPQQRRLARPAARPRPAAARTAAPDRRPRPRGPRPTRPPRQGREPGGPARARAGPATASSSSGSRARASPRSASVTGANGTPSSPRGTQPPRSTSTPCSAAVTATCSASRVLPTPASPPTSATSGSPPAVCASRSRSRASSSARPTKRPVMTWYAMPPSMPALVPHDHAGRPQRPAQCPTTQVNTFTALATTRARMAREMNDWTAMATLAHGARGMASVGLKARALVKPRYR